jgi:hypothetical protein
MKSGNKIPVKATVNPAATIVPVINWNINRFTYTPAVRMNITVNRVKGTIIFSNFSANFKHFHLEINQNILIQNMSTFLQFA